MFKSEERPRRPQPRSLEDDNASRREQGEIEVWPKQQLEITGDPRINWTLLIGGQLESNEVIIFDPNASRQMDISSIIGAVRKGNTELGYKMTAQEALSIKEKTERRAGKTAMRQAS